MEVEVKQISAQLNEAVTLMLNGQTPQNDRMAAYQKIEVFKQESPQMALKCGLFLTTSCPEVNIEVKHFGLKIIEDIIKLRWNEMSLEEKVMIKEAGMRMMDSQGESVLVTINFSHTGCFRKKLRNFIE